MTRQTTRQTIRQTTREQHSLEHSGHCTELLQVLPQTLQHSHIVRTHGGPQRLLLRGCAGSQGLPRREGPLLLRRAAATMSLFQLEEEEAVSRGGMERSPVTGAANLGLQGLVLGSKISTLLGLCVEQALIVFLLLPQSSYLS